MRLKYLFHHRDQERYHQKGKRNSYMLTALPHPRPVQYHLERSPIPMVGKENPGDNQ